MPQQLNEVAGNLLARIVAEQGIQVRLGQAPGVVATIGKRMELRFESASPLGTDIVVISAGITPESSLAKSAGLATAERGGVVVDPQLTTEDPKIFAMGECAHFQGQVYGLAAPGYAMAAHLASRFAGKRVLSFSKPDLSTRLKMLGVEVASIGEPLQEGRRLEFVDESSSTYRYLLLSSRSELVGALGVGAWPEIGRIQTLYYDQAIIRKREQECFLRQGTLSKSSNGAGGPVSEWPDERVVCNCLTIRKGEILACANTGGLRPDRVRQQTGASSVCGSCLPLVEQLCGELPQAMPSRRPGRVLLMLSLCAMIVATATAATPGLPMADSVSSWWYRVDLFWRDAVVKQITGFSLLGVMLAGLLLSLRKRLRWLRFGHLASWRILHVAFGITALVVLFAHTGFHFGHNLNFWLMLSFVCLNLLGAIAGVVAAIESRGTTPAALRARRWRPFLTYAHLVCFWPLPVLLTFHILSVYLY